MFSNPVRVSAPCLLLITLFLGAGCSDVAITAGSTDTVRAARAEPQPALAVEAPAGFRAVSVVEGLTYPIAMTWDGDGNLFVVESRAVPIPLLKPRIVRIGDDGEVRELEFSGDHAPTGERALAIAYSDGWIYFSHDEKDGSFAISRVRPAGGTVEPVLRDIRTSAENGIRSIVFDEAGSMIVGFGSATNAGVAASEDGTWGARSSTAHDVPCRDLVLTGALLQEATAVGRGGRARPTGAFQPPGSVSSSRVRGSTPCSASVARISSEGRTEVIGWGIRNPTGLAIAADGSLLAAAEGMKEGGVRPVSNDPDAVYRIIDGTWYGWPDYGADLQPVTHPSHQVVAGKLPESWAVARALIDHRSTGLEPPDASLLAATLEKGAGVGGIAIVPEGGPFARWAGRVLVAQAGDPVVSSASGAGGFRVEAIDPETGAREMFLRNSGSGEPKPASRLRLTLGLERPIDVKIGPDGMIYVLDFGVYDASGGSPKMFPRTGRVFRVEPIGR